MPTGRMVNGNWMPGSLCGRLSSDMANTPNIFTELPRDLPEELFTKLLQAPGIRIERIVSQGHRPMRIVVVMVGGRIAE